MSRYQCRDFEALNVTNFYVIPEEHWLSFFSIKYTYDILAAVSNSIGVHFWNRFSANETVSIGSNVAYDMLARRYCPRVYQAIDRYF